MKWFELVFVGVSKSKSIVVLGTTLTDSDSNTTIDLIVECSGIYPNETHHGMNAILNLFLEGCFKLIVN